MPQFLFAYANDHQSLKGYLRALVRERKAVKSALDLAEQMGLCRRTFLDDASAGDIVHAFQRHQKEIVLFHYGGHAGSFDLLLQTDEGDGNQAAGGEGLIAFLSRQAGLQVVVLNGCHTYRLAEQLIEAGIPIVIGTDEAVSDRIATNWATRFYKGLSVGLSVKRAFDDAVDEIRMSPQANQLRGMYLETLEEVPSEFPWRIHVHPGKEETLERSLTQFDPLLGLPEPEITTLPDPPFLFFRRYDRAHAPVFFGRAQHIRLLYDRIANPDSAPLILLHGQSGSGKSSLLEAGLVPRLEAEYQVLYLRRDEEQGLMATLHKGLERYGTVAPAAPVADQQDEIEDLLAALEQRLQRQPMDRILQQQLQALRTLRQGRVNGKKAPPSGITAPLLQRWHEIEARSGQALIVILDQVEEVFTRTQQHEQEKEWSAFTHTLQELFSNAGQRPEGKLVLGFRKEYYPELEKALQQYALPRSSIFLPTLTADEIEEVVLGLTTRKHLQEYYQLAVEPELPAIIAGELLQQETSAVAPILQIMLTNMWLEAKAGNPAQPQFTVTLYRRLKRQWWKLDQFVDAQFREIKQQYPQAVEQGALLDLLYEHTSPGGTAQGNKRAHVLAQYRHLANPEALLQSCIHHLLLKEEEEIISLSHDTLAPIIRAKFQQSPRPGQRARRLLEGRVERIEAEAFPPLDRYDLRQVEQGIPYMRQLTEAESKLLQVSRQAEERRRKQRQVLIGAFGLLSVIALLALWFGYRENLRNLDLTADKNQLQKDISEAEQVLNQKREDLQKTEKELGEERINLKILADSTRTLDELARSNNERAKNAESRFRANQLAANALALLQDKQKYGALEKAMAAYKQDPGSPAVLGALLAIAYDTNGVLVQPAAYGYTPTGAHPLNYQLEDLVTGFKILDDSGNSVFEKDLQDFIEQTSFLEGYTDRVYYRLGEQEQVIVWEPLLVPPRAVVSGRITGLGGAQAGSGVFWSTLDGRAGESDPVTSDHQPSPFFVEDRIQHLATNPTGKIVVTLPTSIKLFDQFSFQNSHTLLPEDPGFSLNSVGIDPNGNWLAVAQSKGSLGIYQLDKDPVTKAGSLVSDAPSSQQLDVLFAADGQHLVSIDNQKTLYIWNRSQQRAVKQKVMPDVLTSLAWSPNGKELLVGSSNGQVYRFRWQGSRTNLENAAGKLLQLPTSLTVSAISFQNGRTPQLAIAAGREVFIYEWESLTPVWSYDMGEQIIAIQFSHDGKRLWIGTNTGLFSPLWCNATSVVEQIKQKRYILKDL